MAGYNRISGRSLVESQVLRGYRFTRITSWKATRNKLFSSAMTTHPFFFLFHIFSSTHRSATSIIYINNIFDRIIFCYYYHFFVLLWSLIFRLILLIFLFSMWTKKFTRVNVVFFFSKEKFVFSPLFLSTSFSTNYAIFDCTAIFTIASRSSFFDNPAIV